MENNKRNKGKVFGCVLVVVLLSISFICGYCINGSSKKCSDEVPTKSDSLQKGEELISDDEVRDTIKNLIYDVSFENGKAELDKITLEYDVNYGKVYSFDNVNVHESGATIPFNGTDFSCSYDSLKIDDKKNDSVNVTIECKDDAIVSYPVTIKKENGSWKLDKFIKLSE